MVIFAQSILLIQLQITTVCQDLTVKQASVSQTLLYLYRCNMHSMHSDSQYITFCWFTLLLSLSLVLISMYN